MEILLRIKFRHRHTEAHIAWNVVSKPFYCCFLGWQTNIPCIWRDVVLKGNQTHLYLDDSRAWSFCEPVWSFEGWLRVIFQGSNLLLSYSSLDQSHPCNICCFQTKARTMMMMRMFPRKIRQTIVLWSVDSHWMKVVHWVSHEQRSLSVVTDIFLWIQLQPKQDLQQRLLMTWLMNVMVFVTLFQVLQQHQQTLTCEGNQTRLRTPSSCFPRFYFTSFTKKLLSFFMTTFSIEENRSSQSHALGVPLGLNYVIIVRRCNFPAELT